MYRAVTWALAALLGTLLLALFFTLGFVTGGGDGAGGSSQREPAPSLDEPGDAAAVDFDTLDEILDLLESEYIDSDNLSQQQLYEAAIGGLIDSLGDSGTFYVDPIINQVSIDPSGTFEGIGATVSELNNEIVIIEPINGGPAQAAGLAAGDAILAVDGESTQGWTVEKAVLAIRGPSGTDVTLTIRHVDSTTEDVVITRDVIQVQSVMTQPPGGALRDADGNEVANLEYLRIAEFNQRTPEEVEEVVREVEQDGKEGLILDLRGNPGGLLQETVETADLFLDSGTILIEVGPDEEQKMYHATSGGAALTIPIVILQNQYSASGAEVLAAALRDNERAVIVGETSFGKGTVNTAHQLSDGGALFVTVARWHTPKDILIEGVGIPPDMEVVLAPGTDLRSADAQLYSAIDYLNGLQASEEPSSSSAAP